MKQDVAGSTPTVRLTVDVDATHRVSAIWQSPASAQATLVLAHGAGAGMEHAFMADVAGALAAQGVASLRYNFPAMESGSTRPDRPALAHATVRAAVAIARAHAPALPLFAGGKSFGGRMTSQAQAETPLAHVAGLVFFGFPLHPPKQPAITRAAHLDAVHVPLLFVQGTRDALARRDLLEGVVGALGSRSTMALIEDGDHSFAVPKRSGRSRDEVLASVAETVSAWMARA